MESGQSFNHFVDIPAFLLQYLRTNINSSMNAGINHPPSVAHDKGGTPKNVKI
jgi:hypothetical protein